MLKIMTKRATAWLLLLAMLITTTACTPSQTPTGPTTVPTQSSPVDTEPTVTEPSVTDPEETAPSVTDPVVTQPTEPDPNDPYAGLIDIDTDPLPSSQRTIYDQLFDPDRKIQVDVKISDAELAKIQADYEHYLSFGSKSPIYRMADVVITIDGVGYLIREVGVRMKGNTSRTDFYSEDKGIYNAIHLKLDFQQTFEDEGYYGSDAKVWSNKDQRKARKDRTFATLEELELRWNKSNDYSYLREVYGHQLYLSAGIMTPLINLCSMDLGGVHMGVYTLGEPVDKVFLEKRLPAAELGGDLYKCSHRSSFVPTHSIGVEDEDKGTFFRYDLKTNKKTSDHSSLKNLIAALEDPDITREEFAELVDVDQFLTYAAASWFLGNFDDLRYNYANFYVYFLKSSGKAVIIPYDLDLCMGVAHGGVTSVADPFGDKALIHREPEAQENPLFLHTVIRDSMYVSEYADALDQVSKNPYLKIATFRQWFQRAKRLYGNDVTPSKTLDNMSKRNLAFDMDRSSSYKMNTETYLSNIMDTYETYMAQFREKTT